MAGTSKSIVGRLPEEGLLSLCDMATLSVVVSVRNGSKMTRGLLVDFLLLYPRKGDLWRETFEKELCKSIVSQTNENWTLAAGKGFKTAKDLSDRVS